MEASWVRRALQMLPNMEAALAKRVSVVVVTRPTNAYRDEDRPALEETLASLQHAGVRLVFKANIHQKFAVFDQKIVWYCSINLLSYGSAEESILPSNPKKSPYVKPIATSRFFAYPSDGVCRRRS